jgi:hypothetical protein
MASEKSRRPQFVRIAEFLGLAAGKIHHPRLGLGRDRRLPTGPRPIIERRHRTIGQCPLDAALDRLMVHPNSLSHRKKGRVFPVGQQNSRPPDPARRLRPRPRNRSQSRHILLTHRQFNRLPPSRHDLNPCFRIKQRGYKPCQQK